MVLVLNCFECKALIFNPPVLSEPNVFKWLSFVKEFQRNNLDDLRKDDTHKSYQYVVSCASGFFGKLCFRVAIQNQADASIGREGGFHFLVDTFF